MGAGTRVTVADRFFATKTLRHNSLLPLDLRLSANRFVHSHSVATELSFTNQW